MAGSLKASNFNQLGQYVNSPAVLTTPRDGQAELAWVAWLYTMTACTQMVANLSINLA